MPKPLHIPPEDGNPQRLTLSHRPIVRQNRDRKAAMREIERKQRGFEALMFSIVMSTTLWGGFWIQFVTSVLYNMPALHTLSGGNWFGPHVEYYIPFESPVAASVAQSFAFLSVFGSVLALFGAWHWTRGVNGKWRMRFMVAGFAGFLCLWSFAALAAEDAAWDHLRFEYEKIERELSRLDDDDRWAEWLNMRKDEIERMLEIHGGE